MTQSKKDCCGANSGEVWKFRREGIRRKHRDGPADLPPQAPRGGAKFARARVGDRDADHNLQAAIDALPNGASRWRRLACRTPSGDRPPGRRADKASRRAAQEQMQGITPPRRVSPGFDDAIFPLERKDALLAKPAEGSDWRSPLEWLAKGKFSTGAPPTAAVRRAIQIGKTA